MASQKPLTAMTLRGLKATGGAYYVSDGKQDGLRVRVSAAGLLTWNVTYRIKGEGVRSVSLGKCDPDGREGRSLDEARERAASILKAAREGRDLLVDEQAAKEEAKAALTVEGLIELYVKSIRSPHRRGGALRTADDIERRLTRALKTKLDKPADSLRRGDISRLLDEVAETHPREAEKRRQHTHAMYRWAMSKGYVVENPLAGTPTYGAGEPRDRALDHDEIRTFWRWLDEGANNMPSDVISVLRLQLLLGARAGEIAGMDAAEFALSDGRLVWTLPASRSKNGKARVTPLPARARGMVEAAMKVRSTGGLFRVLDGSRSLTSSDVGQALLNRTLPIAHFSTHDLRRTVVSQMDELGISLDTIAAVVGHQRGTAATRTLIRHYAKAKLDERVLAALSSWDIHLAAIVAGSALPTDGNIVRLAAG